MWRWIKRLFGFERPDLAEVIAMSHLVCKTPAEKQAYVEEKLKKLGIEAQVSTLGDAVLVQGIRYPGDKR